MTLEIFANDDVAVVWCKGRITYSNEAAAFGKKVAELLPRTSHLVLDLSGVEMIDCAGLGKLVALVVQSRANGRSIKLAAPTHRVRNLLEIMRLLSVFEVYSTLDEAMLAFRGEAACSN